jgi:serine/threonine protein kinase
MSLIGQQLEHYQVLRLIGQGSMGEVYLAENTQTLRQVAIKVIQNGFQAEPDEAALDEAFNAFQREMKMISQFDHAHILPYYHFDKLTTDEGLLFYMVMRYYADGSLTDWLARRGTDLLTIQDVGHLIAPVASALQLAHDYGITHGAVKPSNLLIALNSDHPAYPDLLLGDFSLSTALAPILADTNAVRGNYAYMAPEQWQGQTVPATDQYSLAIVVYQLLTGEVPFTGPTQELAHQQLSSIPEVPSKLNTHVSAAIDAVISRALSKDIDDRFPSIQDFALALQQACDYRDMRAALSISHIEAKLGGDRMVTLPDRRQITVTIPSNTQDGQVLHVPGQGSNYYADGARGPLYLTLSVFHQNLMPLPGNSGELYLPNLPGAEEMAAFPSNHHAPAEYDQSLSPLFAYPDGSTAVEDPARPVDDGDALSGVNVIERTRAANSLPATTDEAAKSPAEDAQTLSDDEPIEEMSNEDAIANTPVVPVTVKPITGTIPIVPIAGHPALPESSIASVDPVPVDAAQETDGTEVQAGNAVGNSVTTEKVSQPVRSYQDVNESNAHVVGQVVPPFSAPNRPSKRRGLSPAYIVLIVLIVFALIASALVFTISHNEQASAANARATASTQSQYGTATAQAQAQARANATATQRAANASATAVAQAKATSTAKADLVSMAAANPDLYYSGTSNLAMVDPLTSIASSQWRNHTDNATGQCQFNSLGYQISQTQANTLYNCSNSTSYSNFVFEVQVTIDQGDCGGITVRGDGTNDYFFSICRTGVYTFSKYATGATPVPLASAYSAAINTALGGTNTIAVVAINSTYYLYINSTTQYVNTVTDSSYTQGLFGLAVLANADATTAIFQHARAWTIGS